MLIKIPRTVLNSNDFESQSLFYIIDRISNKIVGGLANLKSRTFRFYRDGIKIQLLTTVLKIDLGCCKKAHR